MELKEIRLRLRKTQYDIAKILDVSQSYIAGLEKGIYKPSKEMEYIIKDLESDAIDMPELEDIPIRKHFSIGVVPLHLINRFNALKKREGLSSVKMFEKLINGNS